MPKRLFSLDLLVARDGSKEASFVGAEVIADSAADALEQHWDLIAAGSVKQIHLVVKEDVGDMFND